MARFLQWLSVLTQLSTRTRKRNEQEISKFVDFFEWFIEHEFKWNNLPQIAWFLFATDNDIKYLINASISLKNLTNKHFLFVQVQQQMIQFLYILSQWIFLFIHQISLEFVVRSGVHFSFQGDIQGMPIPPFKLMWKVEVNCCASLGVMRKRIRLIIKLPKDYLDYQRVANSIVQIFVVLLFWEESQKV